MTDGGATEVISLAEARAESAGDAKLWSVTDCLESVLRDIRAGRIAPDMVYVAMCTTAADGKSVFTYRCAGASYLEALGLLTQHMVSGAIE